jgi:hypothetical protein
MGVVAGTRVIPESLDALWDLLREALWRERGQGEKNGSEPLPLFSVT